MSSYVARLRRPYDYRVLIEAYIYTQRKDFVHSHFTTYYASLLDALQGLFGLRLSGEGLSLEKDAFWGLFQSTVGSLLQITSPWSGYIEAGLLHRWLDESGEAGKSVHSASRVIWDANEASKAAHREMLYALFRLVFGERHPVVTSEELLVYGFDDSREPNFGDYHDYL